MSASVMITNNGDTGNDKINYGGYTNRIDGDADRLGSGLFTSKDLNYEKSANLNKSNTLTTKKREVKDDPSDKNNHYIPKFMGKSTGEHGAGIIRKNS